MRAFRLPILAIRWLLVGAAAFVWVVVVPIVDLVRDGFASLRRGLLRRR
jgi:hypothetical protein